MTDRALFGNRIQPLRNVAALVQLHTALQNRGIGLPGLGVFHGWPGYGKTFACTHLAAAYDAIHISVEEVWTKTTLVETILEELMIHPRKTLAYKSKQVREGLAVSGRTLIIDEADYAVQKGMIPMLRDIHNATECPVIFVGMEELPQKLKKWDLVDSRVHSWVAAQPADLKDVRMLAQVYCAGVELDDDFLEKIIANRKGQHRRISIDLAYALEQSRLQGVDRMSLADWGDQSFLRGDAPAPRRMVG